MKKMILFSLLTLSAYTFSPLCAEEIQNSSCGPDFGQVTQQRGVFQKIGQKLGPFVTGKAARYGTNAAIELGLAGLGVVFPVGGPIIGAALDITAKQPILDVADYLGKKLGKKLTGKQEEKKEIL